MPDSIKIDELSFPFNNKDILSIYSINQANTPEVGSLKSVEKLKELLNMSSLILAARINNEIIGFVVCLEAGAAYTSLNYKFISKKAKKFVYIDKLIVKEAYCGKKITMKRFRPRAKGRAAPILKPYSSVTIILSEVKKMEGHGTKS